MAPHGSTKTSPYELVYGHHAVLPWEVQSDSRRVVLQKDLSSKNYSGLMMDELEDLHMIRIRALENIEKNKLRVAKYYIKKVKVRQFAEGDLVWKALLPIGTKYSEFGKWSPNWEGPFRVVRCVPGNASDTGIAGAQERGRLQNKIPKQREWPVPRCIALRTKLHYKCFLQVYIQQP
jgi:hypothetical protein